jgi:hypothetical protein
LLRGTQFLGVLAFGRLADATSPPSALWVMATLTIGGVLFVWAVAGRLAGGTWSLAVLESESSAAAGGAGS